MSHDAYLSKTIFLLYRRTVMYAYDQSRPLSTSVSCLSYDSSARDYVRERAALCFIASFFQRWLIPTCDSSSLHSSLARAHGKKKKEKKILSQYISHDYSRVYLMEIGITYLYPYDDDGNSNDSIFLPRRQGAHGYTHRTTFAYDESKTITIQSLCSVSFACHRLPCRALHTATAVGWHSKYTRFFYHMTDEHAWLFAQTESIKSVTIEINNVTRLRT